MAFDLSSFSSEFLYEEGEPYTCMRDLAEIDEPTSVWQAVELTRLTEEDYWGHIARDVFDVKPDHLATSTVMEKIRKTNTVDQLHCPIRVYIDDHYYVTVYEKETSS